MDFERRRRYSVLDIEVDAASHVVRRGADAHHLRAQSMAVLIHLLEHPDRLVSKDELLQVVWKDVAVTDEALTQCIKEIRRALGDDHRQPRFLRTVPKAGYQVIAPVLELVLTAPPAEPLEEASPLPDPEPMAPPPLPEAVTRRTSRMDRVAVTIAAMIVGAGVVWSIVGFSQSAAGSAHAEVGTGTELSAAAPAVLTDNAEAYAAYREGLDHVIALRGNAALASFQRAVDLDPQFAMAHGRLGFTHAFILGGSAEAVRHLEAALKFEKRLTEFDRLLLQAWYAVARQDFGSAISLYQEVVRQRPQEAEGHARLAKLLAGEERFEEVLTYLRSGLAIAPNSREMLNELCLVLSDMRRHQEASETCRKLIGVDPRLANSYDSLGMVLDAAGDEGGALAAYDKAIELDPSFEVAVIHRGNLHFRHGRYSRAIEEFQRYVTLAPELHHSRGLEQLALTWSRLGDDKRAQDYLAEARQAGPSDPVSAISVLLASSSKDQIVKLAGGLPYQARLTRGFRLSPRIEAARQGRYTMATGRAEEALRWFRQGLTHRPITWHIEWFDDCLGDAFLELGRFDEAIAEYQRVLREAPQAGIVRFHLAEAYERKGDARAARQHYTGFLEAWRDADANGKEVIAARNRLGR